MLPKPQTKCAIRGKKMPLLIGSDVSVKGKTEWKKKATVHYYNNPQEM